MTIGQFNPAPYVGPSRASLYETDFSEFEVGGPMGGWYGLSTAEQKTHAIVNVTGAISGKALRITKSGTGPFALLWAKVPVQSSAEILMRFRAIGPDPTGASGIAAHFHRFRINQERNSLALIAAASRQVTGRMWSITAQQYNPNGSNLGSTVWGALPNYANGMWGYLRSRLIGSTLQIKLWHSGQAEPAEWMKTETVSLLGEGYVGIGDLVSGLVDAEIDYFAVSPGPSPATIPVPV